MRRFLVVHASASKLPPVSRRTALHVKPNVPAVRRFAMLAGLVSLSACVPAVPLSPTTQPAPSAANEWRVEPAT